MYKFRDRVSVDKEFLNSFIENSGIMEEVDTDKYDIMNIVNSISGYFSNIHCAVQEFNPDREYFTNMTFDCRRYFGENYSINKNKYDINISTDIEKKPLTEKEKEIRRRKHELAEDGRLHKNGNY